MRAIDDLLERARRLPARARRELRDQLTESIEKEARSQPKEPSGPYASLLRSAGTGHGLTQDVARRKNKHLADIYAARHAKR